MRKLVLGVGLVVIGYVVWYLRFGWKYGFERFVNWSYGSEYRRESRMRSKEGEG